MMYYELLHEPIDHFAKQTPGAEALRFNGDGLTYAELQIKANQLANCLLAQGVQRRERVGIYLHKSLEMGVALYAILKAGAAFVPIDPLMPSSRLAFTLNDCGIRHIITQQSKLENLEQLPDTPLECAIGLAPSTQTSYKTVSWGDVAAHAPTFEPLPIIEDDLAYIMYTSGSTGTPKGMMHTHRSGLGFGRWGAVYYDLSGADRLANHAPLHFDLSIFDYFSASQVGGCTVIVPEPVTKFPASFAKLIETERVSVIFTAPFALIQLLLRGALDKRDLSSLRWVLFGGEPYPTKHLRGLMNALPQAQFSNVFGPAETPCCVTYEVEPIAEDDDSPIPIGTVSDNREALVLDENDEPVAPGEVGELLIRGPSMTKGYWQRPELNARVFYFRPKFQNFPDIFFRTGDLVQQRADGNYMFLGRKDRQIKSRGHRVELDEVEAAIIAHDAIEEAAAFVVDDGNGSKAIHAAIILKPNQLLTESDVLAHVRTTLPWYAVPHVVDIKTSFPRTTSDKIDRRALALSATRP